MAGILERLRNEIVIGDGGYACELEKRGYVEAGPWTPEAVVENPEAVTQLHNEFIRAGSDVLQAFTFYASEDKLQNRGNYAGKKYGHVHINEAACRLARNSAAQTNALVAGSVSQTPSYLTDAPSEEVKQKFRDQADIFVKEKVDFLIAEYFEHLEECCFAIEVLKKTGLPVAATMCIGPEGDMHGNTAGECAVNMAEQGADIVGVNCHFDPFVSLNTVQLMKEALEESGYEPEKGKPFLMCQPLGYMTPDAGKQGHIDLPEFPFALEPRMCTRSDVKLFARQAYELGVRYIGGCCGFESYHIRTMCEELVEERGGRIPIASSKGSIVLGEQLQMHTKPWVRCRCTPEYWEKLNPASGRPFSAAQSTPDNWDLTAGDELLVQYCEGEEEGEEEGDEDKENKMPVLETIEIRSAANLTFLEIQNQQNV